MSEKENSSQIPKGAETIDLNSLTDLNFGPSWADNSSVVQNFSQAQLDDKVKSSRKSDRRSSARKDRRGPDKFRKKHSTSNFPRQKDKERKSFHTEIRDPKFDIKIYPQDDTFEALIKQLKASCKTYQLFGITRTILEKHERFVVLINRFKNDTEADQPIFFTPKDRMPFDTEQAAIDHFCENFLEDFFQVKKVEIEAPKGNFSIIYRCPFTKALIGPPNYHRYQDLLKSHHKSKIKNLSLEDYQNKLEGVNDEAIVNEWLQQMKQTEQFCLKNPQVSQANSDTERDASSVDLVADSALGGEASALSDTVGSPTFNSREAAIRYLMTHCKENVVKTAQNFRFAGARIDDLPNGILKDSILHTLQLQQRFPLDTANNIRGRLRRHKFTIYKKGSKGVSFVCCVKRKFRDQSTVFTDSITKLIQFIELQSSPNVQNVPYDFLSILKPSDDKVSEADPLTEQADLSEESTTQVKEVLQNLRWLISEGYVTEYSDGTLFVHPLLDAANAPKANSLEKATKPEASKPEVRDPKENIRLDSLEKAGDSGISEKHSPDDASLEVEKSDLDSNNAAERDTSGEAEAVVEVEASDSEHCESDNSTESS